MSTSTTLRVLASGTVAIVAADGRVIGFDRAPAEPTSAQLADAEDRFAAGWVTP